MEDKWQLADKTGRVVIEAASVLKIDVKADGKVVSEAVESGGFATYNKTEAPLEIAVQLGFEGGNAELGAILDKLRDLKKSVEVFSLVTPLTEFENMTLAGYDFQLTRESGGGGSLYVDLSLVEIRESAVAYSAMNPSDASTVNGGNVSPSDADNEQIEKAQEESILHKTIG
jgi:hypothetical protein